MFTEFLIVDMRFTLVFVEPLKTVGLLYGLAETPVRDPVFKAFLDTETELWHLDLDLVFRIGIIELVDRLMLVLLGFEVLYMVEDILPVNDDVVVPLLDIRDKLRLEILVAL